MCVCVSSSSERKKKLFFFCALFCRLASIFWLKALPFFGSKRFGTISNKLSQTFSKQSKQKKQTKTNKKNESKKISHFIGSVFCSVLVTSSSIKLLSRSNKILFSHIKYYSSCETHHHHRITNYLCFCLHIKKQKEEKRH